MKTRNIVMTGLVAGAAFGAFADFEINLDLGEKPIRDARTSTCGPMVGYAGCLANTDEAYWFSSNKVETARVMREAGAYFQRMWSANAWFKNRTNWHDPNSKDPKEQKAYKNFRPTHPELMFPFWKENGIKVLFTLECWSDDGEKSAVEFVKWIVDNNYKDVVAGFEMGNESYFSKNYPDLAPRWKRVIDELWKIWPKVPLGMVLCELFEENPDLTQVRNRMLSAGEIKTEGYFSAHVFNQYTTRFVVAMSNYMDKVSHVIYHAYGAESPYSCSYYGIQRFRNFAEAFPAVKGKKMWLSEIRVRSDEDNRCQRMFRESLISAHYALMAICQPEMDGYNQHQMSNIHGGLYWSNGRVFQGQWRDDCGGDYADFRAPEGKPRLLVGHMGVMCRILTEAIKEHPLVMSHGTSKAHDVEDAFFTSARVCDQVYARRRALKEGKKPFLGLFGGVPEVEGEVEYVVLLNPHRNRVSIIMVNTKNEKVDFTFRAKGRELAAPAYVTLSCPEEFLDKCVIPGDGAAWRQLSWEDTQTGYYVVPMSVNDGLKLNCEALNLSIAPHTVQSVTFATRNSPKK